MRGTPFDHRCGRVAWQGLKKRRRVQWHCPRAPTPEPSKEGHRPKNRQSQRRKVFLPGCSVFSLSWPACAGAFLVPGRWFSGSAPSGSRLFWFRLMFLFTGRGRHGQAQGHRPKNRTGRPRTGFHRYPSTYDLVVYFVALVLFFPFCFAILFVVVLKLCSLFPSLLQLRLVKLLRSR